MRTLAIDIETYSGTDLNRSTVYRYVEDADFEILLFAYALEDSPVQVLDLTKQRIPENIAQMLSDTETIKTAYNANFERVCLSKYLGKALPPESWHCTMVHAATLGLPRSLDAVGKVLGLPEDKQKMQEGKSLIAYFCKPCKPTKTNGGRTRNLPEHNPDKWQTFMAYNARDVETERHIRRMLEKHPVIPEEHAAYCLDQRINDRGVQVDTCFVDAALRMNRDNKKQLLLEASGISGLSNANSLQQLKKWLENDGLTITNALDKNTVAQMRKDGDLSSAADRLLAIRQETGMASTAKYEAIQRGVCADGRIRGLFVFYGASRSGRWSGKQAQLQNLPQNHIPDLDLARNVALSGDLEGLTTLYGSATSTLSELLRTVFIAKPDRVLAVADFSAIEARIIAWLADEQWRIDLFAKGGDIYCASASRMFHVPVEKHGVNGHLRQKGKIAELALGYGGSAGALKNMGALDMGIMEEELKPLVEAWRASNTGIVDFWWGIDKAARDTIAGRTGWRFDLPKGLSMRYTKNLLHVKLPSGRCLRYYMPGFSTDSLGREQISYMGQEAGQWKTINTYGPKLVENIVQGIARDCLRDAMARVEKVHPDIVMHIHDEMVVEVPEDKAEKALQDILTCMATPIEWAPGLILKGDGYITPYYKKD